MGKIVLEGMKFFAYHGYYKEEQTLGNHFLVDVYVEPDANKLGEYELPVNHKTIYLIVKYEMEKTSKLLENVSERIIQSIVTKYPEAKVLVNIRKCNPPLGGRVQYSFVDSKGKIGLEGMEFFASIGIYNEDKLLANEFIVDVHVTTDVEKASKTDNLDDTINYEAIFWSTKTELGKTTSSLEEAASRIAVNLKSKYDKIFQIDVNLRRKYPPVAGQIPQAAIQIEYNHVKQCAKCKSEMLCYNDANCWCQSFKVLPATQRMLSKLYKGCLCNNCLKLYAVRVN